MNNTTPDTIGGLKNTALFWLGLAMAFAVGIPAALPKDILWFSVGFASLLSTLCLRQFVRVATWRALVTSIKARMLGWIVGLMALRSRWHSRSLSLAVSNQSRKPFNASECDHA